MEINTNISNVSDDEDLNFLRLNALNTLKRPPVAAVPINPTVVQNPQTLHHFNKSHKLKKFNKGFGGGLRGARNSPYNRVRNSNLISVQTVESEQPDNFAANIKISPALVNQPTKLVLPQDRYCNTSSSVEDKNDSTSKFDRYNDSDDSESDSDEEKIVSSSDKELKRSDSLEVLLQELENEIQGGDKPNEVNVESVVKVKAKKLEAYESKGINEEEEDKIEKPPVLTVTKASVEVEKKPYVKNNNFISSYNSQSQGLPQNMHTDRIHHQMPYIEPSVPHIPTFPPVPYANMNVSYDQYGYPMVHHSLDVLQNVQSPPNVRLSPLHIKTDILNTITAPLSPRSAAFVLQNREIIERRKKSPRRSYSRSPTPEFRRSLSPRYRRMSKSPSPLRNNRRSPPIKKLNLRRLSPNMRRVSPNPPLRKSPKQIRKSSERSPIRSHRSPLPQNNIRNRLGVHSSKFEDKRFRNRSSSISLSPSPERVPEVKLESQTNASSDPVLEARRRKFEEKNGPITAGIIRLKPPKLDESDLSNNASNSGIDDEKADVNMEEDKEAEGTEDVVIDDSYIDFDHKVDLFSDEESDDENEGRFKLNNEQKNKVAVLPFSQLMNGVSKNIVKSSLSNSSKRSHDRDKEHRERKNRLGRNDRYRSEKDRSKRSPEKSARHKEEKNDVKLKSDRQKSRSPLRAHVSNSNEEKQAGASEASTKTISSGKRSPKGAEVSRPVKFERRKSPIVSPIESRKIEIKIRHPSKYEEPKKDKEINKSSIVTENVKNKKIGDRKVEVARNMAIDNEEGEIIEDDLEVVEHKDEEDVLINTDVSGDLRAQLSRKRAERQNKVTKVEILPSRLLQNALQGAVFKKKSKKSKSKKSDKEEAAPLDDVEASVFAGVGRTAAKVRDNGVSADINCNAVKKDRKVRVVHKITELVPTSTDGKLPIHLRLGVPGGNVDLFSDPKGHSNKRIKNRGSLEQV